MTRRRTLLGAGCALVLGLSAAAGAVPAGASGPDAQTVEGVVRLRVADPVSGGGTHDEQLVLVAGSEAYELTGADVEPNTRVRATGVRSGDAFVAETITPLGPAGDEVPPQGTTQVLVMLVHWRQPDAVTPQGAHHQMFVDSDAWYDDASYGALGQTGDVTPWMEIDGPAGGRCYGDSASTMAQGKAAAVALGYDLADYDNYALYFPNNSWQPGSDCNGFGGWAYVGAPDLWINGYLDRRVTVHEQGHNYGLLHSHSYLCEQVIIGECAWSDYGDDFDAMGASGLVGHFSASQKDLLGWLDGRSVDLTAGGGATLAPYALDPVATVAARFAVSPARTYWLEYRQAVDFDRALPGAATNGVLLHVVDSSIAGDNGSNLLDTRPGDGVSITSATIRSGESVTTPEGFRVAVGAVGSDGAEVEVQPPVCPDAALEPDDRRGSAARMKVPSTAHRAFCSELDRDWVKFRGRAGDRLRVQTAELAADVDTLLTLYDADGTRLARDDDSGGAYASRIAFRVRKTATYYLRVDQLTRDAGADLTYDLWITRR